MLFCIDLKCVQIKFFLFILFSRNTVPLFYSFWFAIPTNTILYILYSSSFLQFFSGQLLEIDKRYEVGKCFSSVE